MDRRKSQRVALIAGLLFLVLLAEGILFIAAGNAVQKEEERKLGALVSLDPGREAEYVEIFQGEASEGEASAGQEILERYGYRAADIRFFQTIGGYAAVMGGVFLLGSLGVALIGVGSAKQRQRETEEKQRLEEELKELKMSFDRTEERLRREEQETKSLITDISHQLKTPMAALKMSYELTQSTELTEEEKDEFTAREAEEVAKLETLLDSFVHLSRLEADMIRISPVRASLRSTLTQAVSSVYMKAYRRNIDISMEEFEDRQILHDPKWTGEAFVNILDNAVKYSGEGTKITIKVTELVSYIMIEVEDEGIGIPSGEMHKIFQRFFRGESEKVKAMDGSGVGLYLSRKILEDQGGTISVRKGQRSGSDFIVTLPL